MQLYRLTIISDISGVSNTLHSTESKQLEKANKKLSSYEEPSAPLSTNYGLPQADPLDGYEPETENTIDQDSEASDNSVSVTVESDMTSDEMNMKMLMTSVPGVPGEDYPILPNVLSAGETGFSCQGKIAGGED